MKNKSQKLLEQTLSRRFVFLGLVKSLVVGAISWRLFDLQLIENQKYEEDWLYFTLIFVVSFSVIFLINMLINLRVPDFSPILYHVGITLIIFPIINISIDLVYFIKKLFKN